MITSKLEVKERTKWTPGPWETEGLLIRGGQSKCGQYKLYTAGCNYSSDYRTSGEAEANAKLIAAAPELAEACQAMLEAYACNADRTAVATGEDSLHSSVRAARAALRKARGEA